MPKGIKQTSSPIQISGFVVESSVNAFSDTTIDLSLNALDNEVFVVTMVNLDVDEPDMDSTTTEVTASLSATKRSALLGIGGIDQSNIIAAAKRTIVSSSSKSVAFDREDPQFTALEADYLYIVATPDLHLNVQGGGNGNKKSARVRVYGYRAKADAAIYAALVQSELLSE